MRIKLGLGVLAFALIAATGVFAQERSGSAPGGPQSSAEPSPPAQASSDAPEAAPKATRIRVGGNVAAAMLTHTVQPKYPKEAKKEHVQGTVILHCIIAKDGTMLNVEYVSGPPSLMRSAMDAVRQWRYKPTLLYGQPVEVDTTVKVIYTLTGND